MITDSFDINSKPLVNLSDIYGEQKHLVDVCIITFSIQIYKSILNTYDCLKITEIGACNGNIAIYKFNHEGKDIAFYLSPIGSAVASECLIEANWLTGAKKFVVFGSSGSLDYEKTANKFVIPTDAYRDEGMSYHYAYPSDYIKIKNSNVIKSIFEGIRIPYVEGKVWTTDAFLRETKEQMQKRKAEGCIAVEMEIAGLQSVCDFHNLDLYAFVVTGDVLTDDTYDSATLKDANNNIDKFTLALEIIKRI